MAAVMLIADHPKWGGALLAVGAWLVSREPGPSADAERPKAWLAFGLMAALNLAWTPLFFGLQSPALAFVDISLLWGALVWMTLRFGRVRPLAGYLQVPMVLWTAASSARSSRAIRSKGEGSYTDAGMATDGLTPDFRATRKPT